MPYPREMACHYVAVGALVIHNGKVLVVSLTYGVAAGRFNLPGGFLDPGETMEEAVVREVQEETGLEVLPIGLLGVRSLVRSKEDLTDIYCVMRCELISDPEPLKKDIEEIRGTTKSAGEEGDNDGVDEETKKKDGFWDGVV